jgi:hypothetical protein
VSDVGFLLAEDEALKIKLQGLTLTDTKYPAGNPVNVFYRYPDSDKQARYPFMTIELLSVDHATDLQSSDQPIKPTYWPDMTPDASTLLATPLGSGYAMTSYEYVPVWLTYQVRTFVRFAKHDRELHSKLLVTNRVPFRWGYLQVPADGTTRRLDNMGWQQADHMETSQDGDKRVFSKIYTLRTNAELTPFALHSIRTVDFSTITVTSTTS